MLPLLSPRLEFRIPLKPTAKARARVTKNGAYTPASTADYEASLRWYVKSKYHRPCLAGPLKLTCGFYLKKPKKPKHPLPIVKPDLDNLVKAVKDAMNGVLWSDDVQIVDLYAQKRYTVGEPGILLTVEEVEDEDV